MMTVLRLFTGRTGTCGRREGLDRRLPAPDRWDGTLARPRHPAAQDAATRLPRTQSATTSVLRAVYDASEQDRR